MSQAAALRRSASHNWRQPAPSRTKWGYHLAVLGLYLALTIVFTYPLVTHLTTHVPGTYVDEYTFLWNLWWFKQAIFELGTDPFTTNFIFYPVGAGLAFYTLAILNDIIALPLVPFLGIITTSNLIILLAFVLSGYGAFLLTKYLLEENRPSSPWPTMAAAFLSGVVYAFPASRMVYASLGHYNIVCAQWLPFYGLFFIKMMRSLEAARSGIKYALCAGAFLALALLTEYTYGIFLLLLTLLWLAFTPKWLLASRRFWGHAAILALTALIPFSPVLYFMAKELGRGEGFHFPGWGYADILSADLIGLFTPTYLHPLWGQAFADLRARFTDVNTVFLGYTVPLLTIVAALTFGRLVRPWLVGAIGFLVLALGPVLHVNGDYLFDLDGLTITVPLPYIIFHYLPFFNMNRVPNRFSVPLALCLGVLVGYAMNWLLAKAAKAGRWGGWLRNAAPAMLWFLAFSFISLEHLSIPLPLTDARIPKVYQRIAQEPGDFTILPLPLGWRESFRTMGAELTQIQYYQAGHGKRLVNGNASRLPDFKFAYFDRIGLFKSIVDIEMYQEVDAARRQRDKEMAGEVLYFFDIRYVVLHPAIPGRLPYIDTITRTEEYVLQTLPLEPAFAQDGIRVYRTIQPPPKAEISVDFGTPAAWLYQGEGWGENEGGGSGPTFNWATKQGARFFLPLRIMGDYRLTLGLLPFAYPGGPQQTVTVRVNGHPLPQQLTLVPAWAPYEVIIPASLLKPGLNEIALDFGYVISPRQALPPDYNIGGTGVRSPVEVTVQSADSFASIKVEGKEVSPGGIGYNIVILDPHNGQVLAARSFNTAEDPTQSQALADFVAGLAPGQIAAVAGRGKAGAHLTASAAAALQSLGLQGDLRATPAKVHAALGVKGAAPGQALEQITDGPAFIHVGPNADTRTLAVAVDFVTITKIK